MNLEPASRPEPDFRSPGFTNKQPGSSFLLVLQDWTVEAVETVETSSPVEDIPAPASPAGLQDDVVKPADGLPIVLGLSNERRPDSELEKVRAEFAALATTSEGRADPENEATGRTRELVGKAEREKVADELNRAVLRAFAAFSCLPIPPDSSALLFTLT